eukprot:TRINITY_DN5721_c0_g1_i1.p1 TRINITY_DN5721_c0_g1~~TRINITY_DN5721_c0_g1_i1.p1  ORF type:complete len:498 (-),score=131.95 TRINITY_DN5721_c0_g1_i1:795-2288(-)
MSGIYVLEPPTKGKVILNTTMGGIDIELWPKEAPKAVRNFVQLCLEGYYNNTIFHRIIRSFMVQGGDSTGTGTGGESIYGPPFADEFHSRLKFKHRGIVACANAGSPNTNNSQFFMTLDRCDWLDRKHTIFGKVTGDSIFNLLKLGDVETDKDDRPIDSPPKIISVEVLWNPFDDIIPREISRGLEVAPSEQLEKQNKKKAVKKLNLLSFGDEAEEEEQMLANVREKIKSSHDVLNDPRLLKADESVQMDPLETKRKEELQASVREALSAKRSNFLTEDANDSGDSDMSDDDEASFDAKMRQQILRKRKQFGDIVQETQGKSKEKRATEDSSLKPLTDTVESDDNGPRPEKLSMKKKGLGSEAKAELAAKADLDAQLLDPVQQRRQMFKQKKRRQQGREEDTLARLQKFKNAMQKSRLSTDSQTGDSNNDEDDDTSWLTHKLKFMTDALNKDDMARKDDPDAYVVHDPLLEKGKEKFNKMQAKMKRRQREWAGKAIS